jgi:hypothetical protein
MLLRHETSHSVFKTKVKTINDIQFKIIELKYKVKKFYLYNTQIEHAVINLNNPRYFFSVQFENKNLSYEQLYKWCKENHLLENQNISE